MKRTIIVSVLTVITLCSYAQTSDYNRFIGKADSCFMAGDFDGASRMFSKAFAIVEKPMATHLYNAACAAARAGCDTTAMERLWRRVRLYRDWYSDRLNSDGDLVSLHGVAGWSVLCDTMACRKAYFERDYDHELKARLDSIYNRDQMPRHAYLAALRESPQDSSRVQARLREIQACDERNMREIVAILDTYGFPSSKKVGGSNLAIWAVIQHSSLELIDRYLPMFTEAAKNGELDAGLVAMMQDRADIWKGLPQKYGTQGTRDENGCFIVLPLSDAEKVDEWRREVGLPPLDEYIEQMSRL